ncbi:MAG: hypothetical protein WD398_09700 [Cyclobacteriaceae bacterium]
MKYTFKILLAFGLIAGLFSCEEDFGTFNSDNRPEIPVMFTNTTTFGHDPFVEVTEDETIEFVIEIPEDSGLTIAEIAKVGAGSTALNIANLTNDEDYLDAPIPGDGTSVVFTTTLEEFLEKRPDVTVEIPEEGYTEIAFLFLVELSNGDEIVSMRARARVSQ